ncbi:MAG: hypothetical protein ACSHYF_09740 [Verrucomicrobiaceae bacterium]
MKLTPDDIGRSCWIAYLVAIFPACIICGWGAFLLVSGLFDAPVGVVETAPVSALKEYTLMVTACALPFFWVLGVACAHRFNSRWRSTLPFLAHLIPVMFWTVEFFPFPSIEGEAELAPIFYYLAVCSALLVVGLICAVVGSIHPNAEQVGFRGS